MIYRKPYQHQFTADPETVDHVKKYMAKQREANITKLKQLLPTLTESIVLRKQLSKNGATISKEEISPSEIKAKIDEYEKACKDERAIYECIDGISKYKKELIELASQSNEIPGPVKESPPPEFVEKIEELCMTNEKMKKRIKDIIS